VVGTLVSTHAVSFWQIVKISGLAVAFLVGSILIGVPVAPYMLRIAKTLRTRGMLTISAFLFCLSLAWIAHELGLAPIVGAFAAGLVLARTDDLVHIRDRMRPVADILVPVFFVMLGMSVTVSVLNPFNPESRGTLGFIGALVLVAIVMKALAGLGVLKRGVNRLVVGVGMIPRGEVGLIFAAIGLTRKIINPAEYAAIVAVVIITTFITPPLLKSALARTGKRGMAP
jgi:Kef-type K+ transport system membrane component KefB